MTQAQPPLVCEIGAAFAAMPWPYGVRYVAGATTCSLRTPQCVRLNARPLLVPTLLLGGPERARERRGRMGQVSLSACRVHAALGRCARATAQRRGRTCTITTSSTSGYLFSYIRTSRLAEPSMVATSFAPPPSAPPPDVIDSKLTPSRLAAAAARRGYKPLQCERACPPRTL